MPNDVSINPTNAVFNDHFMKTLVEEFHRLQSSFKNSALEHDGVVFTSVYEYLLAKHNIEGMTGDGLRKRLMRYRQRVEQQSLSEQMDNLKVIAAKKSKDVEDEFPDDDLYTPVPAHLTDAPLIYKFIDDWKKYQPRPMRIMVISDIHFPDHNPDVLRLHIEVARRTQPDVIAFIGDQMDFDLISHWGVDMRRRSRDIFNEVQPAWDDFLNALSAVVSSNVPFFVFDGNHEERLWKKMNDWGSVADTLEEKFVALMRGANRRAWYLNGSQEIAIGEHLKLMHGALASANTTSAMLSKEGSYSYTVVQGHVHRPQMAHYRSDMATPGKYRIVNAMVVGCSCNIPPHYYRKTNSPKQWLNGCGIVDVHPNGSFLNLQNILYHQNGNRLSSVIGTDIIEVECKKQQVRA